MEDIRQTHKRRNGGKIYNEPFNPDSIDRLRQMVQTFHGQGKPKIYCVLVDGEIVVEKNADADRFDAYKDFMSDHTKKVEVRMYMGNSPNCNRYIFRTANELSGTPADTLSIEKALEQQRLQMELETLQKLLKKKNKKIKRLIKQQSEAVGTLDNLSGFAEKAVQLIGMFKSAGGVPPTLSGPSQQEPVEVQVESSSPDELTEQEKLYLSLVDQMGTDGMVKALNIVALFVQHPELEQTLNQVLQQKLNNHE